MRTERKRVKGAKEELMVMGMVCVSEGPVVLVGLVQKNHVRHLNHRQNQGPLLCASVNRQVEGLTPFRSIIINFGDFRRQTKHKQH